MRQITTVRELQDAVGEEIGVGPWVVVDQPLVDSFAEISGDHQWIHVDPTRAASSPWGGTIAHGNLIFAIGPKLRGYSIDIPVRHALNYGLDRLRFPSPLLVGSRIRMRTEVARVDVLSPGQVQFTLKNTVEMEGASKPVMVAEPITRVYLHDPVSA